MKRILSLFLVMLSALWLPSCESGSKKVGICLPSETDDIFKVEGEYLLNNFEQAGHEVFIEYCGNNAQNQIDAMKSLTSQKCDVIVISPIDAKVLEQSVADAKAAGINVVAYDKAIDGASTNITFDNSKTGRLIGEYLESKLNLKETKYKLDIEMFCGLASDTDGEKAYNDCLSILQPHFDEGRLNTGSGLREYAKVASAENADKAKEAETRLIKLLAKYYIGSRNLTAIYTSDETLANGVRTALMGSGHNEKSYPVVTTIGCNLNTARCIKNGTQTMAVFSDRGKMLYAAFDIAQKYINGGSGSVASKTFDPVIITKENYRAELIDSGIYSEEQLS